MDAPQAPQKPECTWLITSRRQLYWPAFDLLHVELLPLEAPIAARMLCHFAPAGIMGLNSPKNCLSGKRRCSHSE